LKDHFLDDFYSLQFHYRFSSVRGEMIAFQIIQLVEEKIFANVIENNANPCDATFFFASLFRGNFSLSVACPCPAPWHHFLKDLSHVSSYFVLLLTIVNLAAWPLEVIFLNSRLIFLENGVQ
jgi:hypothetical protein